MRLAGFEIPLDYVWLTNTRLAVTKGIQYGSLEKPMSTGEVIAVDFDGTHYQYQYGHENFKMSSRGQRYGEDY